MRSELMRTGQLPRVQLWRRGIAFAIDFVGVWLISLFISGNSLVGGLLRSLLFIFAWLILRVVVVYRNQGQSLGRWILDMKVVDADLGRVSGLQALLKREIFLAISALFFATGLSSVRLVREGWILLLSIPLLLDFGLAVSDSLRRQALHDRLARTLVVQTRRGYSLDLKIKNLVAQVGQRVKK